MKPKVISGGNFKDNRGNICFNNDFNTKKIKRIYTIENNSMAFVRAWQGHAIESRWFSVINGSFEIKLIKIDNWDKPTKKVKVFSSILNDKKLDTLYVPKGYVSSIQALEKQSKLLVMSDYLLGEVADEYRFDSNYFII